MTSLSEQKEAVCPFCEKTFQKWRHDQKVCLDAACRTAWKRRYMRAYGQTRPDRERQNQLRRERSRLHRDEERAARQKWRAENPTEAKRRDHEKYLRRRTAFLEHSAAYKRAHPEVAQRWYRKHKDTKPWLHCLVGARNRSLKKGFAFNLTREWAEKTWTGKCAVSGIPFQVGDGSHHAFSPSIDRIENSQGYLQDNCRFVIFAVNQLKGVSTDAVMYQIAQAIASASPLSP